jgi:alkylhydroperoxidase family enzyme
VLRSNRAANLYASSNDPKESAALRFAGQIVGARAHVTDADLAAEKAAGFSSAEMVQIVLLVALDALTNYANKMAQADIDFAVARPFN